MEPCDLLRGVVEAGVVAGVLRGAREIDFLAERGVVTFSFSLDFGVPTDFLCCSKHSDCSDYTGE